MDTEKKELTAEIPAGYLDLANERVDKLNRRARRLKVAEIVLSAGEPFLKKVLVPDRDDMFADVEGNAPKMKTVEVPYVKVTLTGEAPKLTGWTLIAQLERIEDAGMVLNVIDGQTVEESWRTAESFCDHCKSKRKRLATYLFRDQTGKVVQIGSDCLKDFQGHDISKVLSFVFEAFGCLEDLEDWGGGGQSNVWWAEDYLAWVSKAIREGGWLSRKLAKETGKTATADVAIMLEAEFARPRSSKRDEKVEPPTEQDKTKAQACLKWVRESMAPKLQKNDYEHNLTLVLSRDVVNVKHLGIAASALPSWERELGRQIEREKKFQDEKKSVFQGEIGKRQVFTTLTLVFDRVFEGDQYGPRTLLKFKDAIGNIFIWWASGERADFQKGEVYDLVATVKKHEEYNGVKQTVINRGAIDGEWGCVCTCGTMTKLDTHCHRGHEKGTWRCDSCHSLNLPTEKTCSGPYLENGVDRKGCGHSKQSWRCKKCYGYNFKKAKACEVKDFEGKICGTPKRAWMCRDYTCQKWNDPKQKFCSCGRDATGYVTKPAEEVKP